MVKILGVDWVPIIVPLERRLQTASVVFFVSLYFILPVICCLIVTILLFTPFYMLSLTYLTWLFYDVYVKQTSRRGGRRWVFFRNISLWHYLRDYFPVSLIKTSDLDTNKNYIFGYHPHGIVSCGASCNFATSATGFSEVFPGIKPHLMTLKANFSLPFIREVILWLGICEVSKESIQWILTKQGKGNAAVIVIGGAEESLEAKPDNYTLKLLRRKGFIKQAIRAGASLVPVYSFGENKLFLQADNPIGSGLRAFQDKFKRIFGFAPPIFYGRGVLNYSFGIVPFREPVYTVVGAAIDVKQMDDPDDTTIDIYHKMYIDALVTLFEKNKTKYGVPNDERLNIT